MADLIEADIKKLDKYAHKLLKDPKDRFFVCRSAEVCATKQIASLPETYLIV